jgi:hypothetical protein
MKSIGKKIKGYFGMSRVYISIWDTLQFRGTPLLVGFTDLDWVNDLMIESLLQVMFSSLVLGPVTWAYKKQ